MVESAIRISHKYDTKRFYNWGLRCQCTYPSTEKPSKDHDEWHNHDPKFLIRLINLTRLVDKRELDGQAALAYYALSIIQWGDYNQNAIFGEINPIILSRVISGRSKILARNVDLVERIQEHRCAAGGQRTIRERQFKRGCWRTVETS